MTSETKPKDVPFDVLIQNMDTYIMEAIFVTMITCIFMALATVFIAFVGRR